MKKIFLTVCILCMALWAVCIPAAATEPTVPLPAETFSEAVTEEAVTDPTHGTEASPETVAVEEGESETESSVLGSLYDRGRRWAEENPSVFASLSSALGVLFFCLSELIGRVKLKKPVITASNNAVEMYRRTEQRVGETFGAMEKLSSGMVHTTREALDRSLDKLGEVQATAEAQLRVIQADREAVLLMARVVGRLLEESSLPQRTRDEIHELMVEADGLMEIPAGSLAEGAAGRAADGAEEVSSDA